MSSCVSPDEEHAADHKESGGIAHENEQSDPWREDVGECVVRSAEDVSTDAIREESAHVDLDRGRQRLNDEWEHEQDADERTDRARSVADDGREAERKEPQRTDIQTAANH